MSPPYKLVISQDADTLKIEESWEDRGIHRNTLGYGVTGQPVTNPFRIQTPREAPSVAFSKWEENRLTSTIDVVVLGESLVRHYAQTMSIHPNGILSLRIQQIGTADSRTSFYLRAQ